MDYNTGVFVNPATFPNGTILAWQFPACDLGADAYYAYPYLGFGWNNATTGPAPNGQFTVTNIAPEQISAINTLTLTLNASIQAITGTTGGFDVMTEFYPTTSAQTNNTWVCECSVMHHLAGGNYTSKGYLDGSTLVASATINGINWHLVHNTNSPQGCRLIWYDYTGNDQLIGTYDLKALIAMAVNAGVLSSSTYVNGLQIGAEPNAGSGQMTINSISITFN